MAAAEQEQVLQIRAAAELLGLPQTAACTAISLLRRAVAVSAEAISVSRCPRKPLLPGNPLVTTACAQDCVAACLFLACKIEEVGFSFSAPMLASADMLAGSALMAESVLSCFRSAYHSTLCMPTQSEPPASSSGSVAQAPVRINDLLNAVECLSGPASQAVSAAFPCLSSPQAGPSRGEDQGSQAASEAFPFPPQPQAGPSRGPDQASMQPLVGARYYAAKARLMRAEQVVLRLTGFQLSFQHPHKYLLNMARAVHCPAPTVQLAVCLVNDAVVHCKFCLQSPSAAVAGACLHLADLLSGEPHVLQPGWQARLGLTEAETGALGADLLTAVSRARPS